MSSPNNPLLLAKLVIPGGSKEPVSTDPDVWGINIAAALGNFPLNGLRCHAGPWGNMAIGDKLTVFWGTGQNVWVETVDKNEVGTQLSMFVPPRHMVDGQFAASYVVKPLGGTDQPSEVMQVLVKLTRPGGHDDNGDDGHSKLIMIIPQDILDGIHAGNVKDGVKISIGKAEGTPPYPFAAAGDVCRVSWGGIFVYGDPLTEEQAEGKAPIIVKIEEAVIREAGDAEAPGVAVVFEVYDCVFNRSEDWSPEQRVPVAVDTTRPDAPLLKETLNNVLDVDKLGDADGTVQIVARDTNKFEVGDIVFIRIKGTPVEGPLIDVELEGVELENVPSIFEHKAPNSVLRLLAKSQITLSYRLKKADDSADLHSNSQFIRAIGEVKRLAAPILTDEDSGALDPALARVELEIPFDKSFAEGHVLTIVMLGTTPGLKPYLPDLPTRPITHNDVVAAKSLWYYIDGAHLNPVNGGTAEFYYQLQIPDTVLDTLNPFEATRAVRESIHSDILRVGEPRLELPQPEVDGVVDGVLPADTAGTTLTVIYTETVTGDEVFMFWIGSITGEYPDSIKLNGLTAGKEVPFPIPAAVIKGNEGGTVIAKYQIKRAAGGISYAEPLEFSVGVALGLKEPKIKEAPNDTSLDPLDAQKALTAVINYDGMLVGDKIIVRWTGAPGTLPAGSHTTDPWPVTTVGPQEIPLAVSVLAFNLAKSITLDYSVTHGTQDPKDSQTRTLAVLPIAQSRLPKPLITQASEAGEGPELDVSQLTSNATLRVNSYPLIALKQYVWLKAKGTLKSGGVYSKTFWQPPASQTNTTWINQGFYTHDFLWVDLRNLEQDSDLELEFKAGFGGSQVESEAVTFALRTYKVKAYENIAPTLDSVKGSPSGAEIPNGGATVETAVILSGIAAKGQKVDVLDGTTSKGQPDADVTTGNWTLSISGLSIKSYSFTAKPLYGTGLPSSPERTMKVVAKLTIDSSEMNLDGFSVKVPEWPKTGRDSVGNTDSRQPQGGVSPYNYRSSNSDIASVDQQGKVTGNRIGEATIFVTDQMQNEVSYPVSVTNVWSLVVNDVKMRASESVDWMNSIGGSSTMKFKFNEDISLVYNVPLPRAQGIWLCAETSQIPGDFWYLMKERNDNGYFSDVPLAKWSAWCLKPLH
ncbi:Ig-like domain-containing protein [Pseudomonas siliginis]|uniref:Ig-like domain-containing protein n=1 Tax=Pseudomonas siliginis TaxID=2842346 RepID=UPI002092BC65|nr:Ig-like domain-containing protein [Pseudomonas siliginis]UST72047.1 Ig-like domain-containing protein [Pseudomonas siliginis]